MKEPTFCVRTQPQSCPFLMFENRKCTSGPIQPLNVSPFSQKCLVRGSLTISVLGNLFRADQHFFTAGTSNGLRLLRSESSIANRSLPFSPAFSCHNSKKKHQPLGQSASSTLLAPDTVYHLCVFMTTTSKARDFLLMRGLPRLFFWLRWIPH